MSSHSSVAKPVFPLADLVSQESDLLFDTLHFVSGWLLQPVVTWARSDDYKKAVEYVSNVRVVNDIMGQAVKMMTILVNVIIMDFQRLSSFYKQTLCK